MNSNVLRGCGLVLIVLSWALPVLGEDAGEEMPDEILMVKPTDPAVLSIDEVARSADAPGAKSPLSLTYLDVQGDWLLTLHEGKGVFVDFEKYHSRAAVYRKVDGGYRLEAQWFSGLVARLGKPRFFDVWVGDAYKRLLWMPGVLYGTGSHRSDSVFELDGKTGMKPVAFEPAPIGFVRLHKAGIAEAVMLEGEGVWKGEHNVIHKPEIGSGHQISFTFYVWNEGDGNANPTAGRVDGAYKIVEGEKGLEIKIDRFKRVVFDKS